MKARPFVRRSDKRKLREKNSSTWGKEYRYPYNNIPIFSNQYTIPIYNAQFQYNVYGQPVVQINEDAEYYNP